MRAVLTGVICLIVVPAALAKKPGAQTTASVAGIYDNFTVGKGSGDLEGMRVVLVAAGDGHYAIVQIAQGGAEDPKPEFVPVRVAIGTPLTNSPGQRSEIPIWFTSLSLRRQINVQMVVMVLEKPG